MIEQLSRGWKVIGAAKRTAIFRQHIFLPIDHFCYRRGKKCPIALITVVACSFDFNLAIPVKPCRLCGIVGQRASFVGLFEHGTSGPGMSFDGCVMREFSPAATF